MPKEPPATQPNPVQDALDHVHTHTIAASNKYPPFKDVAEAHVALENRLRLLRDEAMKARTENYAGRVSRRLAQTAAIAVRALVDLHLAQIDTKPGA